MYSEFDSAIPRGVKTEELSVNVVVCRPILSLQAIQDNQIGLKAPRGVNLPAVVVRVNTFHTLTLLRIELDRLKDSLKAFPVPKFYSLFHVNTDDRLSPYTLVTEHSTFSELEIKDEDVVLVCELPFAVQRSDWVVTVRHHEHNASGGAAEVFVEIEPWKTLESLKKILVNHPSGFQTPELQNYMFLHRGKLMREKESFLWHGVSFADHICVVPVAMGPDQGDKED